MLAHSRCPIAIRVLGVGVGIGLVAAACSSSSTPTETASSAPSSSVSESDGGDTEGGALPLEIANTGGPLEGHTPQGFAGSGTGLFVGDNLNANFPDGEGVQLFVAFAIPAGEGPGVTKALLTSEVLTVSGTPFDDLGSLRAAPVVFDTFGPPVFDDAPVGAAAECRVVGGSGLECDVTPAWLDAVSEGRSHLQLRLRFDTPGDGDGSQDLAMFFLTDSNTNEPGIFTLRLS